MSLQETLFGLIDNPVSDCANCLCRRCANNLNRMYLEWEGNCFCLVCDDCIEYTDKGIKSKMHIDCDCFIISSEDAVIQRNKIRIIK